MMDDSALVAAGKSLRTALILEVIMAFSFLIGLAAMLGAFNGHEPTTTPPIAQVYLAVGLIVTIGVAFRTLQLYGLVVRGDVVGLRRARIRLLAYVAVLFSGILPAPYLFAAAAAVQQA